MQINPNDIVAALDVGDVRVGVASTRVMVALPKPLVTLKRDENFWQQLQTCIHENEIAALVVGLPRGLDGQETEQTKKVRQFTAQLREKIDLPTVFQDEAATSIKAEAELAARGKGYNLSMVDSLAATYILEDFLRENRRGKP